MDDVILPQPSASASTRIVGRTVVFAEGADEERLVYALVNSRQSGRTVFGKEKQTKLTEVEKALFESGDFDIHVLNAQGRGNLSYLEGLSIVPGFGSVSKLVVIWDAANSFDASFTEVTSKLKIAALPAPELPWTPFTENGFETVVCILGMATENEGCLESLVKAALKASSVDDEGFNCVDQYLECLGDADMLNRAQKDKRWINAWLASQKPAGFRLGAAFEKSGLIPLDHAVFDPISIALGL